MERNDYFLDKNPTLDTYWRSIVLLGKNVASYKFALAKSLIEVPTKDSFITLEDLALPFALNIAEHLKQNDKQATSRSSKFLDYCRGFNKREIDEGELKARTVMLGFANVIDAFHNVANTEVERFFVDSRKDRGGITLTDNFYKLVESSQSNNLLYETNSRWRLWETAISLDISPKLIEIHLDSDSQLLYVERAGQRRVDVTSCRDALNGYQKGKCFYCSKEISIEPGLANSCDVDHFFPHLLKSFNFLDINQVWNLVLSCRDCNRGSRGKFERIPHIDYLYGLNKRNNYFIESHHPLKETIINQTGKSASERKSFLQERFNRASDAIPSPQKWQPPQMSGN